MLTDRALPCVASINLVVLSTYIAGIFASFFPATGIGPLRHCVCVCVCVCVCMCVIVPFDDDNGIAASIRRPNSKGASINRESGTKNGSGRTRLRLLSGREGAGEGAQWEGARRE